MWKGGTVFTGSVKVAVKMATGEKKKKGFPGGGRVCGPGGNWMKRQNSTGGERSRSEKKKG